VQSHNLYYYLQNLLNEAHCMAFSMRNTTILAKKNA